MSLRIAILGCGTSSGVPVPGLGWGQCDPANPKNRRRRVSIMISKGDTNFLIDAGPDLREQLLSQDVNHLEGLFITHCHADHIHGLDDLRWINIAMQKEIPCFSNQASMEILRDRFGYAFQPIEQNETTTRKVYHTPVLTANIIEPLQEFTVADMKILPFNQDHGYSISLGLRVENFAYCTDVFDFPEESLAVLEGLDCWVVDCLGYKPHPTHAHLEKVLGWVEQLKPKQTYFTHMNASFDYDTLLNLLPKGIEPAYDDLVIEL